LPFADRAAGLALLAAFLLVSALCSAVGAVSPGHPWLALVSLTPIFVAVRYLSPTVGACFGAVWGGCLCLFSMASAGPASVGSFSAALVAVAVPAAFLYGIPLFTRRFGFSPLAVALGWTLVETAFRSAGLNHGLLSADREYGWLFQVIAGFLGCGFVAFLVAYLNAIIIFMALELCHGWGMVPGHPIYRGSRPFLSWAIVSDYGNIHFPPSSSRAPPVVG
jgi:hypothetical protein